MSLNWGIKHPPTLRLRELGGVNPDEIALTAVAANGDQVTIVTSRQRLRDLLTGRPQADAVRGMFERDEIDVETFERALDVRSSACPWEWPPR